MKTPTALLSLVLTACLSLHAVAQDSVAGSWQAESVSSVEQTEGATLTLTFGGESKATVTYTLAGESQAWHFTYAVIDGQLTLEPANPFGEPKTVTYDIKFDEGKLLLLTPKPEPVEEETDEAEGEGEEGAETEDAPTEEDAEEEAEEEVEEEDTRTPVWVLVKA